jgi:hypothetical protein
LSRESFLETDKGECDDGEVDELGRGDLDIGLVGLWKRNWDWGGGGGGGGGSYQIDKPV